MDLPHPQRNPGRVPHARFRCGRPRCVLMAVPQARRDVIARLRSTSSDGSTGLPGARRAGRSQRSGQAQARVLAVVGTRPEAIKMFSVVRALRERDSRSRRSSAPRVSMRAARRRPRHVRADPRLRPRRDAPRPASPPTSSGRSPAGSRTCAAASVPTSCWCRATPPPRWRPAWPRSTPREGRARGGRPAYLRQLRALAGGGQPPRGRRRLPTCTSRRASWPRRTCSGRASRPSRCTSPGIPGSTRCTGRWPSPRASARSRRRRRRVVIRPSSGEHPRRRRGHRARGQAARRVYPDALFQFFVHPAPAIERAVEAVLGG